jgi:hypothetical protein
MSEYGGEEAQARSDPIRRRLTTRAPASAAARARGALGRVTALHLAIAAALVGVVVSVTRFDPPTYALEPVYTDHLQHEYDAWAFLQIGIKIFYVPMRDWVGVDALHPHLLWDSLPAIYPPGLIAFFMPFGVASNEGLISDLHVHMLMVMTLGVAGVLASVQLYRTLRLTYEPVLTAVLTFFGAILLVRWGLDGFIDSVAAGLALLGIYWLRRSLPGRAVVTMALALSLQYRLWYLWPLVIVVAVARQREIAVWQLACVGAIGVASSFTFVLSFPYQANFHENAAINTNALSIAHGVSLEQGTALAVGLLVIGVVLVLDGPVAAACVSLAFALLFFVDQWEAWYPVLLLPLLAVVRARAAQVAVTLVFLEVLVYLGGFPDFVRTVHLYVDAVR